jgi:hypothetical protein
MVVTETIAIRENIYTEAKVFRQVDSNIPI